VLELSSFQLETTHTLACDAATVLNLTEDHLDRYAGMREYAAAKARIFQGEGAQVLNRDDAWSRGMAIAGRRQMTFGLDRPAEGHYGLIEKTGEYWLARGNEALLPMSELKLAGLHNAANALACLALCEAIGVDRARVLPALREFRGLPHRVEPVGEIDGITFYDDSKGTNVGSTVAALDGLAKQLAPQGGRVILIAGGEGKGQDFSPLAPSVKRAARAVVLIGRDAPLIETAIADAGVEILKAGSMEEAVDRGYRAARAGDVVLLSPACASFDMFRNYKHRGEVFAAAVKAMRHVRAH